LSPFSDLQLRKGVFKEQNASFLGKLFFNKKKKEKTKTPTRNQRKKNPTGK